MNFLNKIKYPKQEIWGRNLPQNQQKSEETKDAKSTVQDDSLLHYLWMT